MYQLIPLLLIVLIGVVYVCACVCVVYGYMYVYQCVLWLGNISIACQYCEIKLYTNDIWQAFSPVNYITCAKYRYV